MRVDVQLAAAEERTIIANLLELYLYDFSPIDGGRIGPDGRFSTPDMLDSVRQADHTPPRDWRVFRFGQPAASPTAA
jgi:hypothetical protein